MASVKSLMSKVPAVAAKSPPKTSLAAGLKVAPTPLIVK